jgi:predicted DNA-binding transcriptional regulator AlpA
MTYYRYNDLREIGIPYCRPYLNMMAKTGRFPRPVRLLNGRLRWERAEVDTWLAGRA